jgi:glycosyltransferase involved in cell wall biosynthesis
MKGLPEFLATRGWDVIVVTSFGDRRAWDSQVAGVTYVHLPMKRNPSPLRDLFAVYCWFKLLRTLRPHVVLAGTPKAGLLGMVSGWFARVPVRVYHLRGLRYETSKGTSRMLLKALERITFLLSTTCLCVSHSLRDVAIRDQLVEAGSIHVLGFGSSNGVDLQKFEESSERVSQTLVLRSRLGLRSNLPTVGFVGRISPDKGIEILVRSHLALLDRGVPHQLLIVGPVEDETLMAEIKRAMYDNPLLFLAGSVDETAIAYRLMDVLCLPTLREGFPNVVLEAAASGVPSVASDATGAIDAVVHEVTGLTFRLSAPESLTDSLDRILNDEVLRKTLGVNAYDTSRKHYDQRIVWENIHTFLTEKSALAPRR